MALKAGMERPHSLWEAEQHTGGQETLFDNNSQSPRTPVKGDSIPSSSTDGFFQSPPIVLNQLEDDIALQRSLKLFLHKHIRQQVTPSLQAFGDKVLSKPILTLVADAEKNLPYLKTWSTWGKRQDELVTSEGWRKLSALGIEEGMVAIGYDNEFAQFSRPWQFYGVATLLRKHLCDANLENDTRNAMQSAYDRLVSTEPEFAWTTGQWMTERQGGSDVSQTETLARYTPDMFEEEENSTASDGTPLGPWLINGFKWFSSATDSQMMVFLARTPNGISTFMAPMRRTVPNSTETVLNGIQIQRLKNKLGTKALPTAELVLKDVRAYLIGTEGQGVKEIATVLNVARVHNAATATGLWGRGLSVVRAFARARKVGLKPLWSKTAFVKSLARLHVEYKANVLLCIFVSSLLGVIEQPEIAAYKSSNSTPSVEATATLSDPSTAAHLFRLLTPVLKGLTAKAAIAGLAECMECMGGVGYLENDDQLYNIARLYRDVNVCSIWEGTTDMMAHDVLRVIFGKTSAEVMSAMDVWVNHATTTAIEAVKIEAVFIRNMWQQWRQEMQVKDHGELELRSREYMQKLGDVVMGSLMILDASSDADGIAIASLHAWMDLKGYATADTSVRWEDIVEGNMKVVFGDHGPQAVERAKL